MGHDITVLAKHNLNVKDIQSLAHDLANRLDMNINYGYMNLEPDRTFLGNTEEEGFVLLGQVVKNPNFKTYCLSDDNYQTRQVVQKYNELYPFIPHAEDAYTIDDRRITSELHNHQFVSYQLHSTEDTGFDNLCIYDEIYENGFGYFSRWWHLCGYFLPNTNADAHFGANTDGLNEYRKMLHATAKKLNTDPLYDQKIYYLDDQSSVLNGVGQGSEYDMTWAELESFVAEKTGELCVDMPRFFIENEYKTVFQGKNEYPQAFFDDGRDIL